jgi:hypothetical protein
VARGLSEFLETIRSGENGIGAISATLSETPALTPETVQACEEDRENAQILERWFAC